LNFHWIRKRQPNWEKMVYKKWRRNYWRSI